MLIVCCSILTLLRINYQLAVAFFLVAVLRLARLTGGLDVGSGDVL